MNAKIPENTDMIIFLSDFRKKVPFSESQPLASVAF